jgi:hypothetical protein
MFIFVPHEGKRSGIFVVYTPIECGDLAMKGECSRSLDLIRLD